MKEQRKGYIPELAGLDLLRFLLSVIVMVFHYYFFYHHPGAQHTPPTNGPFGSVLFLVYKWGFYVVQIFWLLSGFIFYTVYFEDIQSRKISIGEYLMLRLSRLYPLHLLTLLIVAVLQLLFVQKTHIPFWYDTQDSKHFILQLLFMQGWYTNFQQSFNIPAWSVSVEIFIYILFFLVVASGAATKKNIYVIFALSAFFYVFDILGKFADCMLFFFAGNILAKMLIESDNDFKLFLRSCAISLAACTGLVVQKMFFKETIDTIICTELTLVPIAGTMLLFVILAFKKVQTEKIVRIFKNLGDLTYATYMLHYSVIAAIVLFVNAKDITFYDQDWILPAYLTIVLSISWVVFNYFEKPAQHYFRKLYYQSRGLFNPTADKALPDNYSASVEEKTVVQ